MVNATEKENHIEDGVKEYEGVWKFLLKKYGFDKL